MSEVGFSYLNELNDVQRAAVTHLDGPVMVIAGPGSGKTRVLTYRIAHLLLTGVHPGNVLALTFTNKAAKEMKERIERVVGSKANQVWAGTFHSLFARILRSEAHRIGFPNDFTIYDTDDTKGVIDDIIKSMNLDKKTYVASQVRSRISSAKSNLITPKLYKANDDLMALDRMNRRPLIHEIYEKYAAKCLRAGAMDFDDLLLMMFKLLHQNPDNVREKYQRQFKYVMVDEFQDTNFLQYQVIKLLVQYQGSNENICIVGDDAQSIYSFRGATIENILQYEQDFPKVVTFKLEQNYRSTSFIVNAANEVIQNNKNQLQKTIFTTKEDGKKIKIIQAMTDIEEGKRIADNIIEFKNRYNLYNKDFAILYRTNGQSRIFEEQLRRYNIPYRIYGGLSFYSRKEIKDIVCYIRLVVNDKDDEALKRIINYPKRGIGASTVEQIAQIADDNNISMWEVVSNMDFSPRVKKSMDEFVGIIRACKSKAIQTNAYDAAMYIAKASGMLQELKADTTLEGEGRLDNLNSLMDGIKEFVEDDELEIGEAIVDDKSLSVFLQTISLMTDQDKDAPNQDTVTLMSIHSAKGLEFKSVFVVGLEENIFPSFQTLSSPDQVEEERRLFYVAITRAEEYLTLTYANSRYHYGNQRFNDPSRFIEEISEANLDMITILQNKAAKSSDSDFGGFGGPKILGGIKPKVLAPMIPKIDPKDFVAANSDEIKVGMKVLHLKFGEGEVRTIDERDVATIYFAQLSDNQEKRIMLQYSKLQILG
jgi:DNA helicase II / ATP-dependent DNA helicase PcrA